MKKTIYFLIFIFSISRALPHEQQEVPVHQRIVYEAYKLLKLQLSKEENGIADLDFFIGEIENYGHYTGTLTGGSWQEDRDDIVYGYSGSRIYLVAGDRTHTSITHFWDADNPYGKVKLYDGGVFRTNNNGESWETIYSSAEEPVCIAMNSKNNLYIVTVQSKVYREIK